MMDPPLFSLPRPACFVLLVSVVALVFGSPIEFPEERRSPISQRDEAFRYYNYEAENSDSRVNARHHPLENWIRQGSWRDLWKQLRDLWVQWNGGMRKKRDAGQWADEEEQVQLAVLLEAIVNGDPTVEDDLTADENGNWPPFGEEGGLVDGDGAGVEDIVGADGDSGGGSEIGVDAVEGGCSCDKGGGNKGGGDKGGNKGGGGKGGGAGGSKGGGGKGGGGCKGGGNKGGGNKGGGNKGGGNKGGGNKGGGDADAVSLVAAEEENVAVTEGQDEGEECSQGGGKGGNKGGGAVKKGGSETGEESGGAEDVL